MVVKHAVIVHGWYGSPNEKPMAWLKHELEEAGLQVDSPDMPHPDVPTIDDWINKLKSITIKPSETVLIGHSIGCQTILRYIENEKRGKFAGVVLVAPWLGLKKGSMSEKEHKIAESWEKTPINFSQIRDKSKFFELFYSVSDDFVSVDDVLKIKRELNAGAVNLGEKGHLSEDDSIFQWPEVLEVIEKKCLI